MGSHLEPSTFNRCPHLLPWPFKGVLGLSMVGSEPKEAPGDPWGMSSACVLLHSISGCPWRRSDSPVTVRAGSSWEQ